MYEILNRRWGRSGNDSYTKLLLHCNGDDASTIIKDSSRSDHTITANGNAQIDTAQKKFGVSSVLFDGTGDYVSIPDSDNWYMGTDLFTIEFWIRATSFPAGFFSQYISNTEQIGASCNAANIYFYWGDAGIHSVGGVHGMSINIWYHIAIIRGWGDDSNVIALCINGSMIDTTSITNMPQLAAAFEIGRYKTGSGPTIIYHNGWMDEFRISKGIARWTANFTAPSSPYR